MEECKELELLEQAQVFASYKERIWKVAGVHAPCVLRKWPPLVRSVGRGELYACHGHRVRGAPVQRRTHLQWQFLALARGSDRTHGDIRGRAPTTPNTISRQRAGRKFLTFHNFHPPRVSLLLPLLLCGLHIPPILIAVFQREQKPTTPTHASLSSSDVLRS